CLQYSTYPWTF
nr:immunoglobulin light chain junction region [Macaca mulatta]